MPWTLVALLIIAIPLTAINFYVGRTILLALTEVTTWNRNHLRKLVVGFLIFLNLLPAAFFLAYALAGRGVVPAFNGDSFIIDLLLSYPFWIGLVVMIQLMVLFAVLDVLEFAVCRFIPTIRMWWQRRRGAIIVGVVCFILPYSLLVVIRDTWTVRIVKHEIPLPQELKCLSGFRIAQISDVQGDGRTTYDALRRYVETTNSLKPDVVLYGGDLVTSGIRYIDSSAAILGALKSRLGTIAAVGDHEIFTDKSRVLEALGRAGIQVVEDSTIYLDVDSCRIALGVVTYTYRDRPSGQQLSRIVTQERGAYRILLVHQPAEKLVEFARHEGFDLMLSGHTHGGGIAFGIPGLFLLAPVRFHAPAEIVLITLR